jgi:hypothetical protein
MSGIWRLRDGRGGRLAGFEGGELEFVAGVGRVVGDGVQGCAQAFAGSASGAAAEELACAFVGVKTLDDRPGDPLVEGHATQTSLHFGCAKDVLGK